jgi:hypothetical protein
MGRLAFIDSLPDPRSGAIDQPAPAGDRATRLLGDGRTFDIPKVHRTLDEIDRALAAAGFTDRSVTSTGRFFVLATAVRG